MKSKRRSEASGNNERTVILQNDLPWKNRLQRSRCRLLEADSSHRRQRHVNDESAGCLVHQPEPPIAIVRSDGFRIDDEIIALGDRISGIPVVERDVGANDAVNIGIGNLTADGEVFGGVCGQEVKLQASSGGTLI